MSNANEAGPTLGECLDHHNFLIFGEPVEPIDAGTSALASEIARRWNAHPDLVAACEALLSDDLQAYAQAVSLARAAIRKARGAS